MAVTSDAGRLKSGQLGTWDLTVSTVANVGPGTDFYFAFGVIAVTAGVAAVAAAIAWLVVHRHPGAGSSEATPPLGP